MVRRRGPGATHPSTWGGSKSSSSSGGSRGGLSTAEKLASLNPAARAEGQRELAGQTSTQAAQTVSKAKGITVRPGVRGVTTPAVVGRETAATRSVIKEAIRTGREPVTIVRAAQRREAQRLVPPAPEPKKVPLSVFGARAIRAAPPPKTLAEKLVVERRKVLEDIRRSQFKQVQTSKEILKRQFSGVVTLGLLGVGRGVLGLVETARHPVQAAKNAFQALRPKNFQQTVTVLKDEFLVDPVGTIAEFYTYGAALRKAGRTVRRSPVGRFVEEEVFIRTQPVELRTATRKIIKASKVQEKINPARLPTLKKVDFMKVKSLSRIEAKVLERTLKQTDSVVFGSTAARATAGRLGKRLPVPKDVDLATKSVSEFSRKFINNLPSKIRKNYALRKEKVIRRRTGERLFDVKPLARLIPDRSLLTRRGWLPVSGYVTKIVRVRGSVLPRIRRKIAAKGLEIPTRRIVKIKGIRVTGFGEQTVRKGLGTLQVLIEKNIRRAKDPRAFMISLEVQIEALKRAKPITAIGRLRNKRRIRILSDTVRLLKSKAFGRLLERKVPGITRQFPLVAKIDTRRLKKIKVKEVREAVKRRVVKLRPPKVPPRLPPSKVPASRVLKKPSKLPIIQRMTLLPTRIPRRRPPTRIPPKVPPTKIPPSKIFKDPSKLPIVPTALITRLPVRRPPTRIPTRLPPTKIPKVPISKLPKAVRKRLIAKARKKLEKKREKELVKLTEKVLPQQKFIYIADLYSRVYGIKAKPGEKAAFLRAGRVFTGVEARPLIPARLIRRRR